MHAFLQHCIHVHIALFVLYFMDLMYTDKFMFLVYIYASYNFACFNYHIYNMYPRATLRLIAFVIPL